MTYIRLIISALLMSFIGFSAYAGTGPKIEQKSMKRLSVQMYQDYDDGVNDYQLLGYKLAESDIGRYILSIRGNAGSTGDNSTRYLSYLKMKGVDNSSSFQIVAPYEKSYSKSDKIHKFELLLRPSVGKGFIGRGETVYGQIKFSSKKSNNWSSSKKTNSPSFNMNTSADVPTLDIIAISKSPTNNSSTNNSSYGENLIAQVSIQKIDPTNTSVPFRVSCSPALSYTPPSQTVNCNASDSGSGSVCYWSQNVALFAPKQKGTCSLNVQATDQYREPIQDTKNNIAIDTSVVPSVTLSSTSYMVDDDTYQAFPVTVNADATYGCNALILYANPIPTGNSIELGRTYLPAAKNLNWTPNIDFSEVPDGEYTLQADLDVDNDLEPNCVRDNADLDVEKETDLVVLSIDDAAISVDGAYVLGEPADISSININMNAADYNYDYDGLAVTARTPAGQIWSDTVSQTSGLNPSFIVNIDPTDLSSTQDTELVIAMQGSDDPDSNIESETLFLRLNDNDGLEGRSYSNDE